MKTVLHVGCGRDRIAKVRPAFKDWREVRIDVDPAAKPDVLASMTDLAPIGSESADAVYSSHSLEHLDAHEVPLALKEFARVLRPTGFVLITCPDLQEVCRLVANDLLVDTAYVSPEGPVAPIDMLYGHRASIAAGKAFMAHRCGFTATVLAGTLQAAGFAAVRVMRRPESYSLWALAARLPLAEPEAAELARQFLP